MGESSARYQGICCRFYNSSMGATAETDSSVVMGIAIAILSQRYTRSIVFKNLMFDKGTS